MVASAVEKPEKTPIGVHEEIHVEGRRERKKRELRAKIYETARELFLEHGFAVTTVEQIAEAADIAPATFFNHFQSKAAVLQEMTSEVSDYVEAIVRAQLVRSNSPFDCIRGFAKQVVEEVERAKGLARDVLFELMRTTSRPGDAVPYLARLQQPFSRLLHAAQERGEVRTDLESDFLSEMVLGILNTPVMNWMNNEEYPFRARMNEAAEFACEAIELHQKK